jgi:hypothetical protein
MGKQAQFFESIELDFPHDTTVYRFSDIVTNDLSHAITALKNDLSVTVYRRHHIRGWELKE